MCCFRCRYVSIGIFFLVFFIKIYIFLLFYFVIRFDCVFPTRTARFGVALVSKGSIRLKGAENANLFESVDPECSCITCRDYTRAYLHLLFKENCPLASQLLTRHNISYMMRLMRTMRQV